MVDIHNLSLSDFLQMPIKRTPAKDYPGGADGWGWEGETPDIVAEIIFDRLDNGQEIRLMGFVTDGSQSDFEIAEEGLAYWRALYPKLSK